MTNTTTKIMTHFKSDTELKRTFDFVDKCKANGIDCTWKKHIEDNSGNIYGFIVLLDASKEEEFIEMQSKHYQSVRGLVL